MPLVPNSPTLPQGVEYFYRMAACLVLREIIVAGSGGIVTDTAVEEIEHLKSYNFV